MACTCLHRHSSPGHARPARYRVRVWVSLRRTPSAARAQGADDAAGGVDPAFLRARVSQRFGADLTREAGAAAAGRTGDADVPRRAPLAEQRARFDAQARPRQMRSRGAPEVYIRGPGPQWISRSWVQSFVLGALRCTALDTPCGMDERRWKRRAVCFGRQLAKRARRAADGGGEDDEAPSEQRERGGKKRRRGAPGDGGFGADEDGGGLDEDGGGLDEDAFYVDAAAAAHSKKAARKDRRARAGNAEGRRRCRSQRCSL